MATLESPTRPRSEPPAPVHKRWNLRVFSSRGKPDNEAGLLMDKRGFFTAESALRHWQACLPAYTHMKHFMILLSEEE